MLVAIQSAIIGAFALLASANPPDSPMHVTDADKVAIEAAVLDYFHGQGEASIERLNRAFDRDNATMVGVLKNKEGEAVVRSWKDFGETLDSWAANENPPGGDRDGEILSMEVIDGRLATVIFRSTDRFYDALTLAKVDGEWKIIAKAFVLQSP